MEKAVSAFLERAEAHYAERIAENRRQQEAFYTQTLGVEAITRHGMSPAVLAEPGRMRYAPFPEFPDVLRLGVMTGKFLPTNLRFMYPCARHEALALHGFEAEMASVILRNLCLRLLASLPAHMLKLHLVDTVGLGKAFASLSSVSPLIRAQKVLTESGEIDRMLAGIKADAVSLVQGRLSQYRTLRAYNRAVGEKLAEPYRVICIAGYPAGFSRTAVETLDALISTGEESGVMVLLSTDARAVRDYGDKTNLRILNDADAGRVFLLAPDALRAPPELESLAQFSFTLDREAFPETEAVLAAANADIAHHAGRKLTLEEVFAQAPWSENSQDGLAIPLGLIGKDQACMLEVGREQGQHHVLVGGDTGSGKSVLLHNIIMNGAWRYAPEELEFWLLDYKEGVEFAAYRDLPHARVLSMESSREFGLCMLERLVEEMGLRGSQFKQAGAANLAAWRKQSGAPMSRILVVIDEFQRLLSPMDTLGKRAAALLEEIVRLGRASGIHLVLSTQTLAGVDIGEGILENIGIRIVLRMSERSSARFLKADNTVAGSLTKAGDACLNTGKGFSEANVRFKTAFLDREKDLPPLVARLCGAGKALDFRHVFDGRHYLPWQGGRLSAALQQTPAKKAGYVDLALAEPDYITQELARVRLRQQTRSNILMVGDAPEDAVALCALMLFQLWQYPDWQFVILDAQAVDSPLAGCLGALCPENAAERVELTRPSEAEKILVALQNRVIAQRAAESRLPCLLFLLNAPSLSALGNADAFPSPTPARKALLQILREGPEVDVHCIMWSPSVAGCNSGLGRDMLSTFENHILLRGGESHKLLKDQEAPPGPVRGEGAAYLATPLARYGCDPVRLYAPGEILKYVESVWK